MFVHQLLVLGISPFCSIIQPRLTRKKASDALVTKRVIVELPLIVILGRLMHRILHLFRIEHFLLHIRVVGVNATGEHVPGVVTGTRDDILVAEHKKTKLLEL